MLPLSTSCCSISNDLRPCLATALVHLSCRQIRCHDAAVVTCCGMILWVPRFYANLFFIKFVKRKVGLLSFYVLKKPGKQSAWNITLELFQNCLRIFPHLLVFHFWTSSASQMYDLFFKYIWFYSYLLLCWCSSRWILLLNESRLHKFLYCFHEILHFTWPKFLL